MERRTFQLGDWIMKQGELGCTAGVIDDKPRSASVRALETTEVDLRLGADKSLYQFQVKLNTC